MPLGHERVIFIDGRKVHQSGARGVIDVARYGEGEGELTSADAVRSVVQHFLPVVEFESLFGRLFLFLAGNQFPCVTHGSCEQSVEVGLFLTVLGYIAFYLHDGTAFESYRVGCFRCLSVDGLHLDLKGRQVQRECRVAQESVL